MTAVEALQLSTVLAGVGAIQVGLEDWRNRQEYSDSGLMSWPIAQLQWKWTNDERSARVLRIFFGYRTLKIFILARIALATLLISLCFSLSGQVSSWIALGLLVVTITTNIRSPYGGDGADQMMVLVLVVLWLGWLFPDGSIGQRLAFWFVTLQLILSYGVAGIAKLISPKWWSGSGLTDIFSTYSYGSPHLSRIANRSQGVMLAMSWSIIMFEVSFGSVLFAPMQVAMLLFCVGVMFHFGTAMLMSLNTFLFAFLAAYPLAWYCVAGN